MKWIVVVLVNWLPATAQWEMFDYSNDPFPTEASCKSFVERNRDFFVKEANASYKRNDDDYAIVCRTLESFNKIVMPDEFNNMNI